MQIGLAGRQPQQFNERGAGSIISPCVTTRQKSCADFCCGGAKTLAPPLETSHKMFSLRATNISSLRTITRPSITVLNTSLSPTSRAFHATAADMTVKAFFEVEWTGPSVKADPKSGKVLSIDKSVQSE